MTKTTWMKAITALALAAITLSGCATAPTEQARAQRVGVQMFMWNWDSIATECTEQLGPSGIDWVLTAPPQEHIVTTDAWWIQYQPVSYQLESRFGTREQFAEMVKTCAEAGVDVVADAVINHMSASGPGEGWAGSSYDKYDYPGLYTPDDFHYCGGAPDLSITNYNDAFQVQNCELLGLSDLATDQSSVQAKIVAYIEDLISLGVKGIRIDAAKHIAAADLVAITSQLPDDFWVIQEVIRGAGEPIQPEDYLESGDVWEFAFSVDLDNAVSYGETDYLIDSERLAEYAPSESALSFVTNHDTERNGKALSYLKDPLHFAFGTALMLAHSYGTPMLYSGFAYGYYDAPPLLTDDGSVQAAECVANPSEQLTWSDYSDGDWICQHRWNSTLGMIGFRDAVGDEPMVNQIAGYGHIGWGRGELGYIFINVDGESNYLDALQTSLPAGKYCDVLSGGPAPLRDGKCVGLEIAVDSDGIIQQEVPTNSGFAIHHLAKLG